MPELECADGGCRLAGNDVPVGRTRLGAVQPGAGGMDVGAGIDRLLERHAGRRADQPSYTVPSAPRASAAPNPYFPGTGGILGSDPSVNLRRGG